MWLHRRFSQSGTDTGVHEWLKRRQQSTGSHGWNVKGLHSRACLSLPAQRKTSHSNIRAHNSRCKIEKQEGNLPRWQNFVQNQDDVADEQNRFIDLTSQSFGHHRSHLKDITNYCREPVFKKYSPDKATNTPDTFDSGGCMVERHQFSNPFNSTKQDIKRFGSDTDSPATSSDVSACFELPKLSGTYSNNFFAFSEGNGITPNSRKSLRKNQDYSNFSTPVPVLKSHQSQGEFDWYSMKQSENLPSNILSPYSQRLKQGRYSPPESVYEGMVFDKDLSDEDVDSPCVQALSSPRYGSFTEEVPFFTSVSTSCKIHLKKHSAMSQLQQCATNPNEEYMKFINKYRTHSL